VPTPRKGEKQKDFISRCIRDLRHEGYKQDQATAICYSYWRRHQRKKGGAIDVNLDLFQDRIWLLHPSKLDEINLFVQKSLDGSLVIDEEYISAKAGEDGTTGRDDYHIEEGVAVIPIYGTLGKKMNLMSVLSGGTSTELVELAIETALEDDDVSAILLDINSPGGTVEGTKELADFIREAKAIKPIVAFGNGQMTSAAYWIGSAADYVMAYDTSEVGSIGVLTVHYDRSRADEQRGVVRTIVYAGRYKAIRADNAPLSREGREYIQEMVDKYYAMFIEEVSRNRGHSIEDVLGYADGKVYLAPDAAEIGMIDRVGNFSAALAVARELAKDREKDSTFHSAQVSGNANYGDNDTSVATLPYVRSVDENKGGEMEMKLEELKKKYPDLVAQIEEAAKNSAKAEMEKEISKINARLTALEEQNKKLEERNRDLEKENEIRTARERQALADSIWAKVLGESSLPVELHEKIKKFVKVSEFVSEGVFDVEAFEKAISEEINDWATRLQAVSEPVVQGTGITSKATTGVSTEDTDGMTDRDRKVLMELKKKAGIPIEENV